MLAMFLGLLGTAMCIGVYGALTLKKISADSMTFYVFNLIGAILILLSLASDFDLGDVGGIVIEVCWICISIFGIMRHMISSIKGKNNDG